MARQRRLKRGLTILLAALVMVGARPAAAFVRKPHVGPIFPPGLLAAMLAVPVPNLDYHVGLVDATGVALGTATNPLAIAAGTVPGTMNVQGVSGAGVSIVGTNPLILGVADASNLARFLLSAASGADNIAGTNSFLSGGIAINAGGLFDRLRTAPGATATTGTGLLGTGPLLWDSVGATNFVKQAGDGSGRALVVGAAAGGAAVAGNPVLVGGSDGTNAQSLKVNTDGSLAVGGFTKTVQVTVVTSANAYTAGQAIGALNTIAGAARLTGGSGVIESISLADKDNQAASIDVVFFTASITAPTDHTTFAPSATDLFKCVGHVNLSSYTKFSANAVGTASNVGIAFSLPSGTSLFAVLVDRGTPTYTTTSSLQLTCSILQD